MNSAHSYTEGMDVPVPESYAILVTNTWTGKRTLMPGTYDRATVHKALGDFKSKVSRTGSIPNNSYEIVEIKV